MRSENWIGICTVLVAILFAWLSTRPLEVPSRPKVFVKTNHPLYELVISLESPQSLGCPPKITEYKIHVGYADERGGGHTIRDLTLRPSSDNKHVDLFRKTNYLDPALRVCVGTKGELLPGYYHVRAAARNDSGWSAAYTTTVHSNTCTNANYAGSFDVHGLANVYILSLQ